MGTLRSMLPVALMGICLAIGAIALAADVQCQPGQNSCNGTNKADVISGTGSDDSINARKGNDLVKARGGVDSVRGGSGHDRLIGGPGNDTFLLGGLFGGKGDDKLSGQSGSDHLFGDKGDDILKGGGGDDSVIAVSETSDDGKDKVNCGKGENDSATVGPADDHTNCENVTLTVPRR